MYKNFAITLLVLVFLISGINKFFDINGTLKSISSRLPGFSNNICLFLLLCSIFIEVFCSLYIIYCNYSGRDCKNYNNAVFALIVFTILASIMYHLDDKPGLLKNIGLIGGLLLLI